MNEITNQFDVPMTRRSVLRLSATAAAAIATTGLLDGCAADSANPNQATQTKTGDIMPTAILKKTNIVLVHGAFADGSSWSRVIPLLVNDGYKVVAVQNTLTSVVNDVATTRRVIDALSGPTVVVGHSYGGCVITQAAKGAKNVTALVYVAAMAPDEGETNGGQAAQYPATPLGSAIRPDAAGFAYVDRAQFHEIFCADVDKDQAAVMAAVQKPIAGPTFGEKCGPAAWHDVPTYFAISEDDKAIHPEQQKAEAKRMNSTVISLNSSHASLVSHPKEIADLIKQASGE